MSVIDVSELNDWVDESGEISRKAITKSKTMSLITVVPGIKSATALNQISTGVVVQDGSNCGFNPQGSVKFSQRKLEPVAMKAEDSFCSKEIEKKYLQRLLGPGENTENDTGLYSVLSDPITEELALKNEKAIWQSHTTHSNPELAYFNGLLYEIDNATGVNNCSLNGTAFMGNERNIMQALLKEIPEAISDESDLVFLMGTDYMRQYSIAMLNANLYHLKGKDIMDADGSVENTNIPIYSLPGLTGSKRIIVARKSNLYAGVDMTDEDQNINWWYEKKEKTHCYSITWDLDAQIEFPKEILEFTGA